MYIVKTTAGWIKSTGNLQDLRANKTWVAENGDILGGKLLAIIQITEKDYRDSPEGIF